MGVEKLLENSIFTTTLNNFVGWARQYSLWPYPFATACCGIEYMAVMSSDFDIARFGAERPCFSPRQADMLVVLGTITYKMAPILWKVYNMINEPKWVISVGACASSGGMFRTYAILQGIDRIIPVDIYVPGCPPSPGEILDSLVKLQKIVREESLTNPSYKSRYELLSKALEK